MLFSPTSSDVLEAGLDEAGRGCLAGPVFAAAVILPPGFTHPWLNDSKLLNEQQRSTMRTIIEREAVAWAVAMATPAEIDEMNILWASVLAMHRAVDKLSKRPGLLLVDGNKFKPYPGIPHRCIVKGDSQVACIAAASILAKTFRDEYMCQLAQAFPHYGWEHNRGYPTAEHRQAIEHHGETIHHRKSFRLLPDNDQPTLFDW